MRLPIRIPLRRGSDAISPTAHYTGHVWGRNGLSHPELSTTEGRVLFDALAPAMFANRALGESDVLGMFRRFARELARFRAGLYVADIRLGDSNYGLPERAFQAILSSFVRQRVHTHFDAEDFGGGVLRVARFREARLHRADRHPAAGDAANDPAAAGIHLIEASTGRD